MEKLKINKRMGWKNSIGWKISRMLLLVRWKSLEKVRTKGLVLQKIVNICRIFQLEFLYQNNKAFLTKSIMNNYQEEHEKTFQ